LSFRRDDRKRLVKISNEVQHDPHHVSVDLRTCGVCRVCSTVVPGALGTCGSWSPWECPGTLEPKTDPEVAVGVVSQGSEKLHLPPPPDLIEGYEEREIEEILDSRLRRDQLEYLVN